MPMQFEVDFNDKVITVNLEGVVEAQLPLEGWKLRVEGCYDIQLAPLGEDPP